MQWPSQFEHHVICHIDQSRNWTLPGPLEPSFHPLRRRGIFIDVTDDASCEAATTVRRRNLYRKRRFTDLWNRVNIRGAQWCTSQGRDFASHAQYRKAIGPVGRQLDGEYVVVQVKQVAHVSPHGSILSQRQQTAMVL